MIKSFSTIGIIGRVKTAGVKETLQALVEHLQSLQINILIETDTAESLKTCKHPTIPAASLGKNCDLLIVVGGDGSLLHASHAVLNDNIPVLGINRGSLGFLTDIHPSELDKVDAILQGEYILEERFLLSASIRLNDELVGEDAALNEVAIIPDAIPHMIEFEIYIDDTFVCSQASDGLITATPTGSTAYALSGGGPILHPKLDAMVLVPMFSHSLTSRPIVVEGSRRIDVVMSPNNKTSPRVSCDGRAYLPTPVCSQITICKKQQPLLLVHPLDYDYYEALRSKLHWGQKLQSTE